MADNAVLVAIERIRPEMNAIEAENDVDKTSQDHPEAESTPHDHSAVKRRLDIAVALTDAGPCKKHLKITIPRDEIDREMSLSIERLRKDAAVPGFRPGRAPKAYFIKRFRKQLAQEVKTNLLSQSLQQVDEEYKLQPLSQPKLDLEAMEIPDEGPLELELELEVQPQFELPPYQGLKLRSPKVELSDDEVAKEVDRLLEREGRIVPKLEGGAELRDFVVADLTFLAPDGRVLSHFEEIQFRLPHELRLQDGVAPRMGAVLQGVRPGETRAVEVVLGSSVSDPELRSKTITLKVEVKDLKKVELPAISPQTLQPLGYDSLDELRMDMRAYLHRKIQTETRQLLQQQIFDALIQAASIDLPSDLVAREESQAVARLVNQLRLEGHSPEQLRARTAEIRANAHESTRRMFKESLLIAKISEAEGIRVDEEDVELEIQAIAQRTDESPRRVRSRLSKEGGLESLGEQILRRKVLDRILETAVIEDLPIARTSISDEIQTLDIRAVPDLKPAPAPEAATS